MNRAHANALIASELAAHRSARASGDRSAAWASLERAHIVSQPFLGPHLASHRIMFGFAVALGDWREAAGQAVRFVLAPLGALTGRIPIGNTGRSTVSPFAAMPIPDDLRLATAARDEGRSLCR